MPDLLAIIRSHRRGMLTVFFLIALPAMVAPLLNEPLFQVGSTIAVQGSDASAGNRESGLDMRKELELLRSNVLAEQVIAELGANRLFPHADSEERIRQFRQRLSVQPVAGTPVVKIFFLHQKPELAVQAVEALIRLFRLRTSNVQGRRPEEQLALSMRRLRHAENQLAMVQRKSQPDLLGESSRNLAFRHDSLKSRLEAESGKLQSMSTELSVLQQQFAAVPASSEADRTALLQMKLYEHELLKKYKEDDPLLTSVRQQIRMAATRLEKNSSDSDALEKLADRIALAKTAGSSQQEAADSIRREIGQIKDELRRRAKQEEISKGRRQEVERSRAEHETLLASFSKDARNAPSADRVVVIEQPLLLSKPVKPNMLRNIAAAVAFGLIGSLVYALVHQQLRTRKPA